MTATRPPTPRTANRTWDAADDTLLRAKYASTPTTEIATVLERSLGAVYARANGMGLTKSDEYNRSPASGRLRKGVFLNGARPWLAEEDAVIRARYPDEVAAELAKAIDRTAGAISSRANDLGVKKSVAFMASEKAGRIRAGQHRGTATEFKKGQASHNKGKRRPGWSSGRMKETQFPAGAQPYNTMPIGSTRLIEGYLYRKVSEVPHVAYTVNWKAVHRLLWIEANGPVPRGHHLSFKNGNRQDVRIENIESISRAEWIKRHSIHNLQQPLKETVQLLGRLNRKINRRQKEAP